MTSPLFYFTAVSLLAIRGVSASSSVCRNNQGYAIKCPNDTFNYIVGSIIAIAVVIGGILVYAWKRRTKKELAKSQLLTHNSNATPLQPRPNQPNNSVGEVPPAYSPEPPTRSLPAHDKQEDTLPRLMHYTPSREEREAIHTPIPIPHPYIEPAGSPPVFPLSHTNPFRE